MDGNNLQSTLVQVMAWCRQATSHYLRQCWQIYIAIWRHLGHNAWMSIRQQAIIWTNDDQVSLITFGPQWVFMKSYIPLVLLLLSCINLLKLHWKWMFIYLFIHSFIFNFFVIARDNVNGLVQACCILSHWCMLLFIISNMMLSARAFNGPSWYWSLPGPAIYMAQ